MKQQRTKPTTIDLKTLIHSNTLFFDNLIELIPAKFYLSNDDNDSKPWYQGLSKVAKASAKQQTRENIKKARRNRLDPQNPLPKTTLHILEQTQKQNPPQKNQESTNPSLTYEELQQRLHKKLEALKSNRGQGKRSHFERRDRDRDRDGDGDDYLPNKKVKVEKGEVDIEKEVEEATKGIEFGKVKIGLVEDEIDIRNKKRKGGASKAKELERAKRLQEMKMDPEKGEVVAKKHSWKAATSRAAGVKVHDDPKLLKKGMRKEKKRHEKNVGKWKDRVDSREKLKGEKQKKRAGNIAERIEQTKMRKIAKREKKLMRPGFEGRKEGYITGN